MSSRNEAGPRVDRCRVEWKRASGSVSSRIEAGARVDRCRVEWKRGREWIRVESASRMEAGARVDPWRRRRGGSGGWRWRPWGKKRQKTGGGDGDGDDVLLCSMRGLVARVRGVVLCSGGVMSCRHAISSCHISSCQDRPHRYAMASCHIVMPCAHILDHGMRAVIGMRIRAAVRACRFEAAGEWGETRWAGGVITNGGPRDLCASECRERREASST